MKTLRYPPSVQWEVTANCNHNCIHCYNYWRKDFEKIAGMARTNSEEEYLRLTRKILEQKPLFAVITGGEPFLVFDKIKSSIDLFLANGVQVSINTNATLLDDTIADYLCKNRIGIFVSFPCSNPEICDEITSIKGSFNKIVEKLDFAYEKGVSFSNNIVVSKLNIDYVMETVDFLKKRYDIPRVSITRVAKPVNSDETFDQYLLDDDEIKRLQEISVEVAKKYGITVETSCPYTDCSIYSQEAYDMFAHSKICTAGKTSYAVDTEGNVKACPRDGQLYGNILTDDFAKMWEAMHDWRDGSYLPKECQSCAALKRCLGGCRVDAFPFVGRYDQLDRSANLNNLPIQFKDKPPEETENYGTDEEFSLSDRVKFVKDYDAVRVSRGRAYSYVTEESYEFLSSHPTFKVKEIMDVFDVDLSVANSILKTLLFKDIIYKS